MSAKGKNAKGKIEAEVKQLVKFKNKPKKLNITTKKKYVAVFLMQENETFEMVGKKRFDPTKKELSYKGGLYYLVSTTPSFNRGLTGFFYFDVVNGNQMYIGQNSEAPVMTPKMLDKIIKGNLITQLTQNILGSKIGIPVMVMIVGLVMGGLIGYIIGSSI